MNCRQLTSSVAVSEIALALLIKISIPPNFATPASMAFLTLSSERMSHTTASAFPPAFSTSAAAVYIVPGRFGCASVVFAAMMTFAPSLAARSAIANPIPRDAPDTNSVRPFKETRWDLFVAKLLVVSLVRAACASCFHIHEITGMGNRPVGGVRCTAVPTAGERGASIERTYCC